MNTNGGNISTGEPASFSIGTTGAAGDSASLQAGRHTTPADALTIDTSATQAAHTDGRNFSAMPAGFYTGFSLQGARAGTPSAGISVGDFYVPLKHLDKLYSKEDKIQKSQIIDYYMRAAPLILPHITDKPFSMIHFPEGVGGKSFYQKQCPRDAPEWLSSVELKSRKRGVIRWCLVNDAASVIYMANRSVIEMHTWFSRLPDLTRPDIAVIDLDPSGNTGFEEALIIARAFRFLLKKLKVFAVAKTSGKRGVHIYIPIKPLEFGAVQDFLNKLCQVVVGAYPVLATTERAINKRGNKIYLDAVQNASGKTIISPYSLRAMPMLPVSAPLLWEELDDDIRPSDFNINNIFKRMHKIGDPFKNLYDKAQALPRL